MSPDWLNALARYNRWMNDKLYALCATLSDEARKRDSGAYFKSIHGTLNHLLLTDRVWLGRFKGVGGNPSARPLWWSVAHLFNHQTHHRGQITTLLNQQGCDPGVTDLVAMLRAEATV